MGTRILIVEDDEAIADLISLYCENEGFQVTVCPDARAAYCQLDSLETMDNSSTDPVDLALLDVMLPDENGFQICRSIRSRGLCFPVIMLTAKDSESDKITGLNFGADDYLTKPFLPLELMARIKAQLRRAQQYSRPTMPPSQMKDTPREPLAYLDLNIDPIRHEASLGSKTLHLTPTEFAILTVLLEHKGMPVDSQTLFEALHAEEAYIKTSNSMSVHIRHLRDKLGDNSDNPRYIQTVWGIGYKIG